MRNVIITRGIAGLLLGLAVSAPPAAAQETRCTVELETCIEELAEHLRGRGWAGLDLDHDESSGVMVVRKVVESSPAAAAGFQRGDRLLALDGIRYSRENEARLKAALKKFQPGAEVTWTVRRDAETLKIPVVLAPLPEHVLAQWIGQHVLHHLEHPATEKVADKP